MNRSTSRSSGALVGGLVLIGLGILFLIGQFIRFDIWHYLWPFFFIVLGLFFFVGMITGGKEAGAAAIPGSIFIMLGLLFLFQNTFNYWASWAYAWTLIFPTSVGIGLIIYSRWSVKPNLYRVGWLMTIAGLAIFLLFGAFFELMVGLTGYASPGRILWPLLLILAGIFLLFGRNLARFVPGLLSSPAPRAPRDSGQIVDMPTDKKS